MKIFLNILNIETDKNKKLKQKKDWTMHFLL